MASRRTASASARRAGVPLISARALNRALLERQLLTHRHRRGVLETVEHLVGLQAQAPLAPYVALWSRVEDFTAAELAELMRRRKLIRTHAMRTTIHLVSVSDGTALRALMAATHTRSARTNLLRDVAPARVDALLPAARELLAATALSRRELSERLSAHGSAQEAAAVASAASLLVPSVQVTPRGLWGERGPIAWTTIEQWTGDTVPTAPGRAEAFVMRYLAAFGPASVADIRTWSGLSGLGDVVERLRSRLVSFRSPTGAELVDLPDAPRPDPDTPVPPRFLPEFDNVLLSHADRARINDLAATVPLPAGNGAVMGTFLLDGFLRGSWRIERARERATLRLTPFAPISAGDAHALEAEAVRLLAFAAPAAEAVEVAFDAWR